MLARLVSVLPLATAAAISFLVALTMVVTGFMATLEGLLLTKGGLLATGVFVAMLLDRVWAYRPSIIRPEQA